MKKCPWGCALRWLNLSVLGAVLLFMTGCTTLNYVDDDYNEIKRTSIQTDEMFSLNVYEKEEKEDVKIRAGVSETVLENALVLYINVKNNSDGVYKFDMANVSVTSPIGDVTIIPAAQYLEAYQNYEAANYAGLAGMSTTLNQFASIQNQYRMTNANSNDTRLDNTSITPELMQLEGTIKGIQKHTLLSYKYLNPESSEYFYVFLAKPEEYPIVVKYKNLVYKFGSKKNVQK